EITAGKAYLAVGGCFTPSWFSQRPQRNRDFFCDFAFSVSRSALLQDYIKPSVSVYSKAAD
ncbi:MAG TPA: hypothetical protein PLQ32_05625, partial [Flavihumibacter sp.]|nr:hypothetical protein [Flavihumibacter sp.]